MTKLRDRSPAEWYREAARCYVAGHQGCAACEASYCVFRSVWGDRVQYHCAVCGFSVCHEERTATYIAAAGAETEAELTCVKPGAAPE